MRRCWKSMIIIFGTSVLLSSCVQEQGRNEEANEKSYIVSEVSFIEELSQSKVSDRNQFNEIYITEDELDALLISKVSANVSSNTKSSLQKGMYDDFSIALDDIDKDCKVISVSIENEKMLKESGRYRSQNMFSKYHHRCSGSDAIMISGYAPFDERGLSSLEAGRRIINLSINDPLEQNDIIAFTYTDSSPSFCLSPVSAEMNFKHILTSVRFCFSGSSGISGTIEKIRIKGIRYIGNYEFDNLTWHLVDEIKDWSFNIWKEFDSDDKGIELLGEGNTLFFIPQSFSENSFIEIDYVLNISQSGKSRKGTLRAPLSSLGAWENGVSIEYLISFKERLQPKIISSMPDTLFWERKDGPTSLKSFYIQGYNLDAAAASCQMSGNHSSHWSIQSMDFSDDGRTASISFFPLESNPFEVQESRIRFHYPELPDAGQPEAVLIHKGTDIDKLLFAATKKSDFRESSSLGSGYVAVRPKREGKIYLYLNDNGEWASDNVLGKPGGTGYYDWRADFDYLERTFGISADYNESVQMLTVSVSDQQKFEANLGSVVEFHCSLVSGNKDLTILFKLLPDFSVYGLEDFYVGMKRTPVLSGFCGNVKMKAVSTTDVLRFGNFRNQIGTTPIPVQDLFAYSGGRIELEFSSDDDFNDSSFIEEVILHDPKLVIKMSDNRLFVHGDEVSMNVEYYDNLGNLIPRNSFDPKSFEELLDCSFAICPVDGKQFLGMEYYEISSKSGSIYVYLCDVPENYHPQVQYHSLLEAHSKYDYAVCDQVETVIPAFDANGIFSRTASIDDYLSLNVNNQIRVTSDHIYTYGVKSIDDLTCSVVPVSPSSFDNDCISATVTDKDKGHIVFTLYDEDPEDISITHSVGKHKIIVSTVNKHSGKSIFRKDITPYLNVNIHVSVGTGVYLTDYAQDCCLTANIFGDKIEDIEKCSLTDISGENFTRVISSEFNGTSTIYKWHSLAIKADIQAYQSVFGEENAFLTITFSVNSSGSTEHEIENARNIINNVWDDSSGSSFFGYGGLYGLVPEMRLYNGSILRIDNIKTPDLTDESGKGFYYVHILEDLDRNSRGWLNIYDGIGMPHDGYSL